MPSFVVSIARIDFQSLIGPIAKDAVNRLLIVLCCDIAWCKEGTLIAVSHNNNGHIIVFATLIKTVLVVADDIAVNTRPETSKADIAVAKLHSRHLAHLFEVLFLQVFLESQTLLLGTLL